MKEKDNYIVMCNNHDNHDTIGKKINERSHMAVLQ